MNMLIRLGLLALVALARTAAPLTAAAQPAASPLAQASSQRPPADRVVLQLEDLVGAALQLNLGLLVSSVDNNVAELEVDAAGSVFNPGISANPVEYSVGEGEITLSDVTTPPGAGVASGTQTGLVGDASVSGTLPFSTRYSAGFSTAATQYRMIDYDSWSTSLVATLSQPLLRGAGAEITRSGITLAELAADASQQRLGRSAELTIADVESAYWNLGAAQELETVAHESLQRAQELLDRNQQLLELELMAEADLITARRGVAARQTTLTEAIHLREDSVDRLIFLVFGEEAWERLRALGLEVAAETPTNELPEVPTIEVLEERVLAERHDLAAAALDIRRSEVSYDIADDNTRPDLSLVASYTASTAATDALRLYSVGQVGDTRFNGLNAGIRFSYPLGNDLALARRAQAQLDVQRSQLVRTAVENEIVAGVRDAVRAMQANEQRFEQASQALQLATEQYDNGLQQLQLGLIDSFRLLQFDDDRLAAAVIEVRARYDLAAAITEYELALGSIDDKYDPGLSERYR